MSEVRRARPDEAPALARLWLESRNAAPIPATVHSDADVRDWIAEVLLRSGAVWVMTEGDEPVAMMALGQGQVEQLYVAPSLQGAGPWDAPARVGPVRAGCAGALDV